jgi:hypothetical protein
MFAVNVSTATPQAPRPQGKAGAGKASHRREPSAMAAQIAASLFSHGAPRGGGRGGGVSGGVGRAARPAVVAHSPYENIKGPRPIVVLDGPNVAMRHGRGKTFSSVGIQHAILYYQTRGHRVVAILPESYLDEERAAKLRRAAQVRVHGFALVVVVL